MSCIKTPCRVERDESIGIKVVFAVIDADGKDIVVTPCALVWEQDSIALAEAHAQSLCDALNRLVDVRDPGVSP